MSGPGFDYPVPVPAVAFSSLLFALLSRQFGTHYCERPGAPLDSLHLPPLIRAARVEIPMPIRATSHFTWQVLRAAKRSKKPLTGKELRVSPTRHTKDGSFLTELVEEGLLSRVSGSGDKPFEATYALTEKGQHAAEYGEYQYEFNAPARRVGRCNERGAIPRAQGAMSSPKWKPEGQALLGTDTDKRGRCGQPAGVVR